MMRLSKWIALLALTTSLIVQNQALQATHAELEEKANQGDAQAQCKFALTYINKEKRPSSEDYQNFVEWLTKSANQNYAEAQFRLAEQYSVDMRIQNKPLSRTLYQRAVEQGYPQAQHKLGLIYLKESLPEEGLSLLESAATQGIAGAQYKLGEMYQCGEYVKRDLSIAVQYYEQAVEQCDDSATHKIGMMYENGTYYEKNLLIALKYFLKSPKKSSNELKKLVNFIPFEWSQDNESILKQNKKMLDSFTQASGIFEKRNTINSGDHNFRDRRLAFPYLRFHYQNIFDFNLTLLNIVKDYSSPGFMISCFEPSSQKIIDDFKISTSQEIKYHYFDGKHFLTFGSENVKKADEVIKIVNEEKNHVHKNILELIKLLQKNRSNNLEAAFALQQQEIFKLAPNIQNQNVEELLKNYTELLEDCDQELYYLEQLSLMPEKLKELLTDKNQNSYRNQKFFEVNPGIRFAFNYQ